MNKQVYFVKMHNDSLIIMVSTCFKCKTKYQMANI